MNQDKKFYDNLNFVRAFLAILVTWSHCYPLTASNEPISSIIPTETGGSIAVKAFFFISGLLVTTSWTRSENSIEFIAARCLRIIPALSVALTLTICLAFISSDVSGDLFFPAAADYFAKNITLFSGVQYELPGAYANQATSSVNGSLWTLPWEVRAYLILLIIGVLGGFRFKPVAHIALILLCIILLLPGLDVFYDNKEAPLMLLSFFIGSYVGININTVKLEYFSIAFSIAGSLFLYFDKLHLGILFLIFSFTIIFGFTNHLHLVRMKNDPSFGIYVFSFPVQQFTVYIFPNISPMQLFIVVLAIVYPMGIISWVLLEKKALALRKPIISLFNNRISIKLANTGLLLILAFFAPSFFQKIQLNITPQHEERNAQKDTIWGVYIPSLQLLSLRDALSSGYADREITLNPHESIPLIANWEDGSPSLALFNTDTCSFTTYKSMSQEKILMQYDFPCTGNKPQPLAGDWSGDRSIKPGIYFSDLGLVILQTANNTLSEFYFGEPNAQLQAIAGDWNSDGITTIGLWNQREKRFDLTNANTSSVAEISFTPDNAIVNDGDKAFALTMGSTPAVGLYNSKLGTYSFISLENAALIIKLEYGPKGDDQLIPIFNVSLSN